MPRQIRKYKVELNSAQNLRDLLQYVIELSDEQLNQIQNEMNKLTNSSDLTNEPMDSKAKYAKAMNDFISAKNKATSQKIEVAKMLNEVIKHDGDLKDMQEDKGSSFSLTELQKFVDESMTNMSKSNETKVLSLKKP